MADFTLMDQGSVSYSMCHLTFLGNSRWFYHHSSTWLLCYRLLQLTSRLHSNTANTTIMDFDANKLVLIIQSLVYYTGRRSASASTTSQLQESRRTIKVHLQGAGWGTDGLPKDLFTPVSYVIGKTPFLMSAKNEMASGPSARALTSGRDDLLYRPVTCADNGWSIP
jgi:hypothetical protein